MESPESDAEGSSLELSWDEVKEFLGVVKEEAMDEVKEEVLEEMVESPPIEITPLVCTWVVC